MGLNFVIQLFINGVMKQMWHLLNMLQIVEIFTLIVSMPANIQIFASELNDVVNFKLIPPEIVDQVITNVVGEQARNDTAPLNMTDALNST